MRLKKPDLVTRNVSQEQREAVMSIFLGQAKW